MGRMEVTIKHNGEIKGVMPGECAGVYPGTLPHRGGVG